MNAAGCMYCEQGEALKKITLKVVDLSASTLYLLKDQSFRGRCVLALKAHRKEVFELCEAEREAFFRDLAASAQTMYRLFHPDKLNYGVFGDLVPHFHLHLVPKYSDGPLWGRPYCEAKVEPRFLPEEELSDLAERIRHALPEGGRI